MNDLINVKEFYPIVKLIQELRFNPTKNTLWVKIVIPNGLVLDHDKVLSMFESDAEINYEDGSLPEFSGTVKSKQLSEYLYLEYIKFLNS